MENGKKKKMTKDDLLACFLMLQVTKSANVHYFPFQSERYSTSADMWSLGAVISFYCNKGEHLFKDPRSVERWKGGKSTIRRDKYSINLRQLVADLLSPNASSRPSAEKVWEESCKDNRQEGD